MRQRHTEEPHYTLKCGKTKSSKVKIGQCCLFRLKFRHEWIDLKKHGTHVNNNKTEYSTLIP